MTKTCPAVALAACLLLPCARADEITLSNGEWRPFMSESLAHNGVISRVVAESFALEGVTVRYTFKPWSRAFAEAASGASQGSIVWSRGTPGSTRERDFVFSDTVLEDRSVFFIRKGFVFNFKALPDLTKYKVGGVTGYEYLFDHIEGLRIDRAPSEELSMRKLIAGRFDVFPCSYQVGMYMLRTRFSAAEASSIVVYPHAYNVTQYYLILPRSLAGSAGLVRKFNRGLAKLKKSGRYGQYMADFEAGRY